MKGFLKTTEGFFCGFSMYLEFYFEKNKSGVFCNFHIFKTQLRQGLYYAISVKLMEGS